MKPGKLFLQLLVGALILITPEPMVAQESQETETQVQGHELALEEFLELAIEKDTEFEKILIDELALQYEKALNLPAGDLVLEVKAQYDFILDQEREEPGGSVGLSKLFPFTGTTLEADYSSASSLTALENTSAFTFQVSQPIAENAFGKATRLKDKIVGLEIDVARHQIIEAYEDYLATIIIGYYDWYEAFENLKVGQSSYRENMRLLDNIKERQQSKIALPIDVNKVNLQVLAKKEKLLQLEEEYEKALNFIEKAIRYEGDEPLIPLAPGLYRDLVIDFEEDFNQFREQSRTYQVLSLLEDKSELEVDEEADDLLPSIDLLFGYNVKGKDHDIKNEDNMIYAGASLEWPIGDQVDRAEYETSKLDLKQTRLANQGTHYQLYTDIKDLSVQIRTEQELGAIAKEKIGLAQDILEDETENYSFGKVTLNDYIDAVNVLDTNRFNEILHDAQYKKLLIEWLRITDRLILKGTAPFFTMRKRALSPSTLTKSSE